jgi:hypothetical protein
VADLAVDLPDDDSEPAELPWIAPTPEVEDEVDAILATVGQGGHPAGWVEPFELAGLTVVRVEDLLTLQMERDAARASAEYWRIEHRRLTLAWLAFCRLLSGRPRPEPEKGADVAA